MNIKQLISLKISDSSRNKGLMDLVFILLLAIFSIGLYFNTFYNDYCLDDAMVITENKITQKGFAGIKEHLTNDFLFGFRSIKSEKKYPFLWFIELISSSSTFREKTLSLNVTFRHQYNLKSYSTFRNHAKVYKNTDIGFGSSQLATSDFFPCDL